MMMEFLNVFCVPAICFHIYCRRLNKEMVFDCRNLVRYFIMSVAIFVITFIGMKVLGAVVGLSAGPDSQFYTLVAVVVSFILPYVYEVYKKYVNVSCEIKEKKKEH